MTTENLVIVAVLLVLLAEVTYLVAKLPRQVGNSKKRMIFVDTSVLIDGRIIAVAKSGFIGDQLVIPRSVIGELQFLADNADHDKRTRARYGLDLVKDLQELPDVDVTILQDGSKAEEGVDERLLNLSKKYNGAVCTIDYNLNKVAVVEGITVLNVNELAQSLRMAYLPGEKIMLELVQKGQDSHQAVGYLPDGTMVVVEHAIKNLGQKIEIEFIRSLQTAAGKMMFAKRVEEVKAPVHKTLKAKVQQKAKSLTTKKDKSVPEEKEQAVTVAPGVYHSDEREQRKVAKVQKPKASGRAPRAQQQSSSSSDRTHDTSKTPTQVNTPQQGRRKPKTSAQREAALIDLVDNQ